MEYEIWSMKYEIWDMKYELWNMKSGIWNMKYDIWNIKNELSFIQIIEMRNEQRKDMNREIKLNKKRNEVKWQMKSN